MCLYSRSEKTYGLDVEGMLAINRKKVILGFSRYHLVFFRHSGTLTGTQQHVKKFVLSNITIQRGSQHCQSVLSLVKAFAGEWNFRCIVHCILYFGLWSTSQPKRQKETKWSRLKTVDLKIKHECETTRQVIK